MSFFHYFLDFTYKFIKLMYTTQSWLLKNPPKIKKKNTKVFFGGFIEILVKRQINEILVFMSLFYN